jgi:uncharacterized small protein (DUF1192 family)
MPLFGKKKTEEKQPAEVPDELPSLSDSGIGENAPQKPAANAAEIQPGQPAQAETKPPEPTATPEGQPVLEKPAAPEPLAQPARQEQPAEAEPQPSPAQDEKPTGLIDHITVIDKLKSRIASTGDEIAGLKAQLTEKKDLLQKLEHELADELDIIKIELGLDSGSGTASITTHSDAKKHDQLFHFADGTVASDAHELMQRLASVSDDVFRHHCNAERNDFYYWVRDILNDQELAKGLKSIHSRKEILQLLIE